MKRCPTCNKTFTDRNLSFCIDDGTPLVTVDDPADEVTVVSPSPADRSGESNRIPPYQPPQPYVPPGTPTGQAKSRTWPYVVGILALVLLLFAGLGIAAAILIPKMMKRNESIANANTNVRRVENFNSNQNENPSNSNAAVNSNENSDVDDSTAPTDEQEVLSDLTDLENEWTVANINADKKTLDRILADDYVGSTADGRSQGKAEYLNTIERDTTIQKWEFDDLKVDLNGDRASLNGIIRLQINDQPVVYRFTDKFVWREGRWQATGSEVTPIK